MDQAFFSSIRKCNPVQTSDADLSGSFNSASNPEIGAINI